MKARIHRGTKEIGGTCIEIESSGNRIALDVGLPLDAPADGHERLLPRVSGFREADDTLCGVIISHPHQDHYGLAKYLHPQVPVYIGKAAHNILRVASAYVPNGQAFSAPRFIEHRETITIGPFRVTPFLVDHSAFDAYALLVEAEGKRVFYSGDFRGHGRKAGLFEFMIEHPPTGIDVLLMEGTTIGRSGSGKGFATEAELEEQFVQAYLETSGIHLVWASAQNIDRIVTVFRAAKRAGRVFIVDLYTAVVLEATGRPTIPQSHWEDVHVYIPHPQRVFVKEKKLFDDLKRHAAHRIYPENLPGIKDRAVMLFRPQHLRDHGVLATLDGARLSYSMWRGYLEDAYTGGIVQTLERRGVPMEIIHTSGHASVADLRRFASALAPRMLVPIHSFETARFGEFFENVLRKDDGVWWEV